MCYLLGLSTFCGLLYTITVYHPFPNETLNTIACVLSCFLFTAFCHIANNIEEKYRDRISALEEKVEELEKGGAE